MDQAAGQVDVVVLTRPGHSIPEPVLAGLQNQTNVPLKIHQVTGARLPTDRTRWETIARARQIGSQSGHSPWLMFVDDDVVLHSSCVSQLLSELQRRPLWAALAADYSGQSNAGGPSAHVTMGATLFRRSAFSRFQFRWADNCCECRCCTDDLRRQGLQIDYLPTAQATHLTAAQRLQLGRRFATVRATAEPAAVPADSASPQILVALNRRHVDRFRNLFLHTLRAWGNSETVQVVGYGLYPSEVQRLSNLPGVCVTNHSVNGIMPPVRRLRDFQPLTAALPPQTPVAYWDAGDVMFQASLRPLWQLVRRHPQQLLAVREPKGFPHNQAAVAWPLSIQHPLYRRQAVQLFATNPFLNSGFAAGTAAAMLQYLQTADQLRNSPHLAGTTDWGDQSALNLYCHSRPHAWQEIAEGWNYCLHDRRRGEVLISREGLIQSRHGSPVYVVHGNARSLRKFELPWSREAVAGPGVGASS